MYLFVHSLGNLSMDWIWRLRFVGSVEELGKSRESMSMPIMWVFGTRIAKSWAQAPIEQDD